MAELRLKIISWDKFNPRKDVKHPRWFAMSNRIMEDPKLFQLSAEEWKAWIYILCQASQEAAGEIDIYFDHMEMIARIPRASFLSALDKLENTGVIESVRKRTQSVRGRTRTSRDTTLQDITEQNKEESQAPEALPLLAIVWNSNCGELATVKKTNKARNRKAASVWSENSPEDWMAIVKRVAKSSFCSGKNDRGWKATFDWLIQPETHLKIQEGKYDCSAASAGGGTDWIDDGLKGSEAAG